LRRGAATYVVASAGSKVDSILVTVLALGQSICTGAANPLELGVGQVITGVSGSGVCVHSTTAGAEYAIVPFYDSGVPSATTQVEVRAQGVAPLPLPVATMISSPMLRSIPSGLQRDESFESSLRDREREEIPARLQSARSWMQSRRSVSPRAAQVAAVPAVGDLLTLNVNARDFCANPDLRTGRVAAVTDKAVVVSDTANPVGGFTDAEYRSIGVTFDTLIDPVDRAAFGAVTDIDNNGHVILFFHARRERGNAGWSEQRRTRFLLRQRSIAEDRFARTVHRQQRRRDVLSPRAGSNGCRQLEQAIYGASADVVQRDRSRTNISI
jgi:hypothetical protein